MKSESFKMLLCSGLPGLFHQPALVFHHLCSPLFCKDNLDSTFCKSIPGCIKIARSILKSKVGHPQYQRQVLPLPHTHLEAPPFLPQPKGCCSPPSQDDIKTNSVEKHLNIWMPNLCVDLVSLSHLFLLKALRKTGQIWSTLHSTFIDP